MKGVGPQQDDEEDEAEAIIKQMLQDGYFQQFAQGSSFYNQISEKDEDDYDSEMEQSSKKKPKKVKRDPQEEPQISEPKEGGSIAIFKDSLIDFTEENLKKGYEVGFKGCRQFIRYGDGRRGLEYNPSAEDNKKVPIWNILQKFKEQELSRVPMPVLINEPISMLQKTSEMMTNVSILENAANT